ncbi:MAG: DUF4249 family protein [Cyclobacteriaceae bacterium]|nr:DUF4249 family protein [Cyclobacteriaceae bacterium]
MKSYKILIIIAFGLITGCDSGVELENIPTEDLFSVSSFISPQDTLLTAYVYHARGLGQLDNPDLALVKDSVVIISDTNTADTLKHNEEIRRYQIEPKNIILKESSQYFLAVITPTGRLLKATCIIPPRPELPSIAGWRESDDYRFTIHWDNPSAHRYFTLVTFGEGNYEYTYPWGTITEQVIARLLDDIQFPSDAQQDYNEYEGIAIRAFLSSSPKLVVSLRNVESNLYKYFKSYRAYDDWNANNTDSLFPNFQQPAPVFSNIDNGVGIFAGYNSISLRIKL